MKTYSGDVIALKSSLEIRAGDQSKFGPRARAKANARGHSKAEGLVSIIIPGANGFVPQNPYCRYHKNAPLSCKPRVKVSNSQFQGDGNNPPFEDTRY